MNARKRLILSAVLLAACDAGTPVAEDPIEFEPVPDGPAAQQFLPGEPSLLTASGSDWWPRIEGDRVAWYRSAPAAEQGLWRMDLATGDREHVWAGEMRGPFALRDGRVYWGGTDALRVHDPASGIQVLSDQWYNYAWIDVSDRYVTGIARVGSDRPFYLDRVTGAEAWIPTPTAVQAAHGWGEYLSWTDRRDGLHIAQHFLLHIPSGTETRVTDQSELLTAVNAEMEDGRLAYFDRRYCPGGISVYDVATGATTGVPLGSSCPAVAALQGDVLVTYHPDATWPSMAVVVRDLETGAEAELPLAGNASRRVDADLDGTRMVFTTAEGLALVELAPPPAPVALAGGPYEGMEGRSLLLDASASTSAAALPGELHFSWTFGDGSGAEGPQVEHAWADDGTFTATVTVTDPLGQSSTASARVVVENAPPDVQANTLIQPRSFRAVEGSPIPLRPAFSDPGADDAPWSWAVFVDGERLESGSVAEQGTLPEVVWTPESAGDHTVRVEVLDADGGLGGAELRFLVSEPEPTVRALRVWAGSGTQNNAPAPESNGRLPVMVMGAPDLPVGQHDLASFRAGPAGASPIEDGDGLGRLGDFNGDGFPDVLLHFRMRDTGLSAGDTEVCVVGDSELGAVQGCGPIRIAGS
ncbi:MAG TPA: PKD domain-containing protein [Longimicrobiales bacterium]|nr:PKD domain-containing protein [Longimicrobiales bacterium]